MTETDALPTTTDRRLAELAHAAALAHHVAAFADYSTAAHATHVYDFRACPHPDCALVRAIAGGRLDLEGPMTETAETPRTPAAPPLEAGMAAGTTTITRCACGVPLGTAHYCAAQDHNWVKAPERPEPADG